MNRKHSLQIFRAALEAANPEKAVRRHLKVHRGNLIAGRRRYPLDSFDRIWVIGAGKASGRMARAVEELLGRRIAGGWINSNDASSKLKRIHLQIAGHPLPDERGVEGAHRMLDIAREAGKRDLILALISGGASALAPAPADPVTLPEKQQITRSLLASGATIHEMNAVRKHLSEFKGGHLAAVAAPATVVALILSDVIGDDLDVIGSGPTVPDRSTTAQAARILDKYGIPQPSRWLETPKPGDSAFDRVQNLIVGGNRLAMDAAAKAARALGYHTMILSTRIDGETCEVARVHAAIVKEILESGRPLRTPACLLSGGETTVTLRGDGLGGRNMEFVLAASLALEDAGRVTIFSAGTDGIDGPTDAAGAIADESTVSRAGAMGLQARTFLDRNDSYHFFDKTGGLIKTGPTGTNVMDVRMFLIGVTARPS